MEWSRLLNPARSVDGKFEEKGIKLRTNFLSHYSRDPDRVLFSSAFRRLQGKTQVYIFPNTDFVRNRLTHSLEAASIGRNLSTGIIKRLEEQKSLFKKSDIKSITSSDISDCIAAACLAHDLGNPPFGHVGEYAIRSWFSESPHVKEIINDSSMQDGRSYDFEFFDGNAQAFRIVSRLQGWGYHKGGLRLTATTLGSLVKYPNKSDADEKLHKRGKFGFYHEDENEFIKLAECLGLKKKSDGAYARHPLAFITEAADDIAYLTSDVEDARKFGMINWDEAESILLEPASLLKSFDAQEFDRIKIPKDRIRFLRATASLAMIEHCVQEFVNNEDAILSGDMSRSLLTASLGEVEKKIRHLNEEKIYHQYKKIKAETGAYEIIRYILNVFSEAINNYLSKNPTTERSRNLLKLMDPTGKFITNEKSAYKMYLILIDFVSGMTDRFAVDIFETISGKKLALGF